MNNAQLYLAWLRTFAPAVYAAAVRKATGQTKSLGGLADDLVNKAFAPDLAHSFLGDDTGLADGSVDEFDFLNSGGPSITTDFAPDLSTPTFDTGTATFTPVAINSGTSVVAPATASGAPSSVFTGILAAVTAIGAGVITATNQQKLVTLNTQRAAQGLPPVDATGKIVPGYSTATTSPTLLAFEKAISGSSGSMLPIILGVLGIGAAIMFLNRKSA